MKKANTTLYITCDTECPYCEAYVDLFKQECLTDGEYIYKELLPPNESWGKDNWGKIVKCPECGKKMTINKVLW